MYRPPLRMDDAFQVWVNQMFHATGLDRNQIMRLAIFTAPFGALFKSKIDIHTRKNGLTPPPPWSPKHNDLWLRQTIGESREDVCQEEKQLLGNIGQTQIHDNTI